MTHQERQIAKVVAASLAFPIVADELATIQRQIDQNYTDTQKLVGLHQQRSALADRRADLLEILTETTL